MTIDQAVREYLLGLGPLTALVASRVYSLQLPQNERRASVKMQGISRDAPQHLRGPRYPAKSRIQVCAYVYESQSSDALGDAEAIMDAVHGDGLGPNATGLFGFVGSIGGSPATFRIANVELAYERGSFYEGDENRKVGFQRDYLVYWTPLT